jgi:hypothetical protein
MRTVRNHIREGRLKAVRIGGRYRISAEDLAAISGRPASAFSQEPVRRHRQVEVSSIVDIAAISPETAGRMTAMLLGVAGSRRPGDEPVRVETIYDEEGARMKVILVGGMDTNAEMFKLIRAILEPRI